MKLLTFTLIDLKINFSNCFSLNCVRQQIYDKRDDFNFKIVNVPFLDGDVPRPPSIGVFIL